MQRSLTNGSILRRLVTGENLPKFPLVRKRAFRELAKQGNQARDARNWLAAVEFYGAALKLNPSALGLTVQFGHALKETGQFDAAYDAYCSVLAKTPRDDDLHLQIGHLEKLRGHVSAALSHYKKAVEINPANRNAESEYAHLQGLLGVPRDVAAEEHRRAAVPSHPSNGVLNTLVASGKAPAASAQPTQETPRTPAALRRAGDKARDARHWREAADYYADYLTLTPKDFDVWTQRANCLREAKDFVGSAAAYRAGLAIVPTDSDLYLQLGRVLNLQGQPEAALQAYRQSFQLKPLRSVFAEIRTLGATIDLTDDVLFQDRTSSHTYLEISDLLTVMMSQAVVSGIQRVQFGLLSYVLSQSEKSPASGIDFVIWYENNTWRLPKQFLGVLVHNYKNTGGSKFESQRKIIEHIYESSVLIQLGRGDIFMSTGVIYFHPDLVLQRDKMRNSGVRIGAAIYDFIPLMHPEFCHPSLIGQFSPSIAEALLQIDFAITISDYVADETKRLLQESSYPVIAVRAVPLARDLDEMATKPDQDTDPWTPAIAALRGSEYVLSVSTLNAHKNHIFLVNLWRLLLQEGVSLPKLVLVGRRNYGVDDLFHQLHSSANLDGHVLVIDGPTDEEVATLYQNCLFTMFPSYVEGWGLPVGESLAHGKLCIASKTTSIPEVGGDLVLYFDPYNVREGADIVRRLLGDRDELRALEAKLRANFRGRSWDEYGSDFMGAVAELTSPGTGVMQANPGPQLSSGRMLKLRKAPQGWQFGTRLPPFEQIIDNVLPRLVLTHGWGPLEASGAKMVGQAARLSLPTNAAPGSKIEAVLRLQADPSYLSAKVTAETGCGAHVITCPSRDGRRDILLRIAGTVDAASRLDLDLTSSSAAAFMLIALSWTPCGEVRDPLPPRQILRPTALLGSNGAAVSAGSYDAVQIALRRRAMLANSWMEPEAWGAWMIGETASLSFAIDPAIGTACRVMLQLRLTPAAHGLVVSAVAGRSAISRPAGSGAAQSLVLALDCEASEGRVEIRLSLSGRPDSGGPCVGLEGFIYGAANEADQRALADAMLFATTGESDDAALRSALRFTVTGHVNGTYSLANVNRELALALEAASAGSVRLQQVEVQPTRDLSTIPHTQRAKITALAARPPQADGMEVTISQHWPVWEPPEPGDLPLAFTFWEEGIAPYDMVQALNRSFRAVLAPSRSVAKALVDSGVRVPIRTIGFAPDLSGFAQAGSDRAARIRPPVSKPAPFTFLHVSSCFPRKGADVLLKSYANAFTAANPVKLIIKTFPNPHNDVEDQIKKLKADYPDLAPITVINRDISPEALCRLYGEADAMVLPSRGEGFNIPAAEALAAGLQLVVTGFGAHVDFVEPAFARLVDYAFAPSQSHLKSAGSTWVDPDAQDLAIAMQEVFDLAQPHQAVELKRRTVAGQAAALALADAAAWAKRVQDAALDVMTVPERNPPVVAWISSWDTLCGIAEYSRMLLDAYPGAARNVRILCDERTQMQDAATGAALQATIAWRTNDSSSIEPLASQIERTGAPVVVIQHHKALIRWVDLTRLLQDPRVSRRSVICLLHNVQEILPSDDPGHVALIAALAGTARVLVHTANDLNILKSYGLVANVTLFPHGAPRASFAPRLPRLLPATAAPLIGAYGFLLPHKGLASLIDALALLRRDWPHARLRMVTAKYPIWFSDQTLQDCQAQARSLGLEHAIEWHTEFLPMEASLALLNECDVVALPYQTTPESSSASVRSALASAAPVVVTPIPIFDDVGDAVLRLHGTDLNSIFTGISWFLRHEKVRADFQLQAARWQQENAWDRVSARLHDMIMGLSART